MNRGFVVVLFLVTVLGLGDCHGYKGPEWRQTYDKEEPKEEASELKAYGYEECEDWVRPHEEPLEEEIHMMDAPNGQHHNMRPHMPKTEDMACSHYECPDFPVLESAGCGYMTRYIPSAHWIVTTVDFSVPEPAREAYIRLHRYRYKNNDAGVRIPSTRPTLTLEWLDENGDMTHSEMAMYVSEEFQDVPPASTDPLTYIEKWEDFTVYSRSYGGYLEDNLFEEQFDLLSEALSDQGIETAKFLRIKAAFTYHRYGSQRLEAILRSSKNGQQGSLAE